MVKRFLLQNSALASQGATNLSNMTKDLGSGQQQQEAQKSFEEKMKALLNKENLQELHKENNSVNVAIWTNQTKK